MHTRTWNIWRQSLLFLHTFKSFHYDGVPLAMLLLRDFQKYALHHPWVLDRVPAAKSGPIRNLQAACRPYLINAQPDLHKSGYTLIRAELFGVTIDSDEERIVYVAHHLREYRHMVKVKECRPLIYLHSLPPAVLPPAWEKQTMSRLRALVSSGTTPAVFRQPAFRSWLKRRVRLAMLHIRRVHTLFDRYPVRRTIYGSTVNHHGVLITSFAQTRNVHTVNVQHGLFGPLGHLPVNADLNFVWGKSHADFLIAHGAPKDTIVVSGPCFYRNLPKRTVATQDSSKPAGGRLKVLVALQPLGNRYNSAMIRKIELAVKPLNRHVAVTYKLHPDQGSGKQYRKYLKRDKSAILPHGSMPLNRLIEQADVVLTPFSSVAYEALVCGKPVFFHRRLRSVYYIRGKPVCFETSLRLRQLLAQAIVNRAYLPKLHAKIGVIDKVKPGWNSNRFIWETLRSLSVPAPAYSCRYHNGDSGLITKSEEEET